jgi:hypothetical protein
MARTVKKDQDPVTREFTVVDTQTKLILFRSQERYERDRFFMQECKRRIAREREQP